jgi:hypothetical protein
MAAKKKTSKKKASKKKAKRNTANKVRAANSSAKKSPAKRLSRAKAAKPKARRRGTRDRNAPKKRARTRTSRREGNSVFPVARTPNTISRDADSQGLSALERADSESVSELLDEGNSFEAGVVSGVERADDADEGEVRTREVPEDDVPEEYLDNDL